MFSIRDYQHLLDEEIKQDIHIHPRPNCFCTAVIHEYVDFCIELGIKTVGFVEHGRRVNSTHQGVLIDINHINRFSNCIDTAKELYAIYDIKIKSGIEIDYSPDTKYMQNVIQNCQGLDYIIGSVHGFGKKSYKEYLQATTDLIETNKIDILGHFVISPEIENYLSEIENILNILNAKQICLELNKAERYDCKNQQLKASFWDMVLAHNVCLSFGSDAHSITELIHNNSRSWFN